MRIEWKWFVLDSSKSLHHPVVQYTSVQKFAGTFSSAANINGNLFIIFNVGLIAGGNVISTVFSANEPK